MMFDIYIPSLNLIVEYQGVQHYYDHFMLGDVKSQLERDKQKRIACKYLNITYLEVPYWWQYDKDSILAIIHQVRPDIVPHALGHPFQYLKRRSNKFVNVKKY